MIKCKEGLVKIKGDKATIQSELICIIQSLIKNKVFTKEGILKDISNMIADDGGTNLSYVLDKIMSDLGTLDHMQDIISKLNARANKEHGGDDE